MMRRIIIDCDPGIDDAQAIIMAYQHPETKIEAITTVAGNVGVDLTTANVLKILDILAAPIIPVYAGAASALVEPCENASFFHGNDGLGDSGLTNSSRKVKDEHAALALVRMAKENPGELELIAIGPLTNLALALRLDPLLPSRYKRLVVMGGAYYAQGNTRNLPAEFNFYADPEAASVVLDQWPQITMVSWETTISHGIHLADYQSLLNKENPRSDFLKQITKNSFDYLINMLNREMSFLADPLAMAVLLEPEIVLGSDLVHVEIERFGRLSRGMTVVDWWGTTKRSPNVNIVKKLDTDRFYQQLQNSFE
jgi:purine nucleosidase